jgi:hypothetical protein
LIWLNDYFAIQVLLLLLIILFYNYTELFFSILNLITILLLFSAYLWLYNSDLYTNFILIIDLGLFFVLLCFLINVSWLFSNDTGKLSNLKIMHDWIFILSILLLCIVLSSFLNFNLTPRTESVVHNFLLNFELFFFNWISIYQTLFLSDLQLMGDVYFNFNLLEFILLNFLLYIAILITYFFLNYFTLFMKFSKQIVQTNQNFNFVFLLKSQDMQRQIIQAQSVKAWFKDFN